MDVFADIRSRLRAIQPLLAALGLLEGARREGSGWKIRCPVHAERTPSCNVSHGPDGTIRVKCMGGCGWSGDVLHLVAAAEGDGRRISRRALERAAELAGVDLPEPQGAGGTSPRTPLSPAPRVPPPQRFTPAPVRRIPKAEIAALWRACRSPNVTEVEPLESDLAAEAFLTSRGWWPAQLARLPFVRLLPPPELEHAWPTWWPAAWAKSWRLAVLAYTADGTPAAIHARAVDGATPKDRWPLAQRHGYTCAGLLFADLAGRALLAGAPRPAGAPPLAGVLLCEGLTDFVAASLDVLATGRPFAVLGGGSGSFGALAEVAPRWPAGVPAIVMVDQDTAGEKYVREITTALAGVDIRRARPPARLEAPAA